MKKLLSLFLAILFLLGTVTVSNAENEPFKGVIVDETIESITVMNESGTILTFVPGENTELPAIGSTVTVSYSGSLDTQLKADTITIDAEAVQLTAEVTVTAVSESAFIATLADSSVKEFHLADTTSITGKADALAEGQKANVIYVETAYAATAQAVEITADAPQAVDPDSLINKTLSGKVTNLTGSKITIKTKKGKSWTFKMSKKTKKRGKYDLAVGSTVTITYDGYASKHPLAKRITVKKPASDKEYKTKSGTVSQYIPGDCMLLKSGHYFYITGSTKMTGKGEQQIGTKVTITYYVKNGENYATKIKWKQ